MVRAVRSGVVVVSLTVGLHSVWPGTVSAQRILRPPEPPPRTETHARGDSRSSVTSRDVRSEPGRSPAVSGEYLIGPSDVLSVFVWHEPTLTADVLVRPDGRISLPLVNDVTAAGLSPTALKDQLTQQLSRFLEDPVVTVVVKVINSSRVFITGQVKTPGAHVLSGPTTVLQLIALAGGLSEFADRDDIVVTRTQGGTARTYRFDYDKAVRKGDMSQNLLLQPGDTVVVP